MLGLAGVALVLLARRRWAAAAAVAAAAAPVGLVVAAVVIAAAAVAGRAGSAGREAADGHAGRDGGEAAVPLSTAGRWLAALVAVAIVAQFAYRSPRTPTSPPRTSFQLQRKAGQALTVSPTQPRAVARGRRRRGRRRGVASRRLRRRRSGSAPSPRSRPGWSPSTWSGAIWYELLRRETAALLAVLALAATARLAPRRVRGAAGAVAVGAAAVVALVGLRATLTAPQFGMRVADGSRAEWQVFVSATPSRSCASSTRRRGPPALVAVDPLSGFGPEVFDRGWRRLRSVQPTPVTPLDPAAADYLLVTPARRSSPTASSPRRPGRPRRARPVSHGHVHRRAVRHPGARLRSQPSSASASSSMPRWWASSWTTVTLTSSTSSSVSAHSKHSGSGRSRSCRTARRSPTARSGGMPSYRPSSSGSSGMLVLDDDRDVVEAVPQRVGQLVERLAHELFEPLERDRLHRRKDRSRSGHLRYPACRRPRCGRLRSAAEPTGPHPRPRTDVARQEHLAAPST